MEVVPITTNSLSWLRSQFSTDINKLPIPKNTVPKEACIQSELKGKEREIFCFLAP